MNRVVSFRASVDHSVMGPHLLSDFLEAVEDRYTGDAVYLAQRVQTHRVEMLLAGYLGVLYDCCR